MKSKNLLSVKGFTGMVFSILITVSLQSQVQIQGLINENEGAASWDADGSGPEPYGNGHSTFAYYVAGREYVDPNSSYCSHVTGIGADFPAFAQALADHGFLPEQVKLKNGLTSQGDDLQGSDWFVFGNENYMNFYPLNLTFYLNDELLFIGQTNYMIYHLGPSTGNFFHCTSNYFVPVDASGNSSAAVQEVAAAFMQDVGDLELKVLLHTLGTPQGFSGNGRIGSYRSFEGTLEKGRPELPFQGLAVDHEGFAGWDADGTGPEPKGNGHDSQKYYIASRDYDDIDPDPNAGFAHMIENGIKGFQNFTLQLAYLGFTMDQVKIKMGLRDLGEDIEGEDWSYVYPIHHVNFYHADITAEINGEKVFGFVCDTAKSYQNSNNPALGWWGTSAITSVYDASANSSADIQAVAASFFKDMEQRQIQTVTTLATYANETFSGNGRLGGGFWQINEAKLVACPMKGMQVLPGDVSGQWTMEEHPYIVTGDITIPDEQTLVIDPGVWVKFSDRITFKVDGAIQAIGDSSNTGSVVFTAVNPELGWGHFVFDSTAITNEVSVFSHCIFEYGYAPEAVPWSEPTNCGGAIAMRAYDNVIIENCLFHHNRALNDAYWVAGGGAIGLWTSSPVIRNSIFSSNSANWSGAISCTFGSSPDIVNCLFYGNRSLKSILDGGGAILAGADANPRLINNTFVNNHSNFRGGALEIYDQSNSDLINNIFWGNTAPQNSQIYISSYGCNVDIKYNDIQDGQAGIGPYGIGSGVYENNIDDDPVFADILALDYQLGDGSPCIDGGIPNVSGLNLPWEDLLGNWRIWDGGVNGEIVDMGPYEYGAPPYFTSIENNLACSTDLVLKCYPNPVAEKGTISYHLTQPSFVKIEMYNYLGQKVQELFNDTQPNGTYEIQFNAGNLKTGVYILKLTTKSHDHFFKFTKID